MISRLFKLPTGSLVSDINVYANAWSDLGNAFAVFLGPEWTSWAFDPDIRLERRSELKRGTYGWEGRADYTDGDRAWQVVDNLNISPRLAQELMDRNNDVITNRSS